MSLNQQQNKI
uniref:Uncharacterized protein n=1 Tax=Rhizophora mucronata TaxID=61149 RepID=A0A2P2R004_RHIMU